MALDSEIICQLKQQIIDSWHDHDGGTPAEAARHYAEEARLNPVFDDSGALEGEEQIQAWFWLYLPSILHQGTEWLLEQ